ncbi:unnamed protein product [Lymnaea stagnalis]|uniref:Uncharacterized protein n=1 Tax=Lymnaea stagnalis TaxID=6523 RepID=A0AAV2GZ71_LYMST
MYKLTSCSSATCVVELSHQAVDLDTVSMPLIKRTLPLELFKRVKKEKKSFEDNYGRVSSKTDHHWQSGVEDVTKDHTGSNRLAHISRHHREKDNQSLGSDHTELYGKDKDLDDSADLIIVEALEDPYIIKKCPDVPMTGGLCNTIQGQVRSYLHENENYLVVEDLCRIFSDTDIYERLEKDNYILYSCTAEIGDFLNGINNNFPRLRSVQQCLIKGNDIGAHITEEDYITSNVAPIVGNGSSKRPICKQEIFDDLCSSPKQRRCDFPPLNEEQKMVSVESPGANSLSDDSDSQENSATVIFNEEEHLANDSRRVDDISLNNSSTDTIKLTIGILNDIKIRSESRANESSDLLTSKIDSHDAAFPKDIIPVTVTNYAIDGPSIANCDMPELPGVSDSQNQVNVGPSVSGSDISCSEEPMEMSDNLSDTTATAQSCDAESDQDKRPETTETETSSSQSEIDVSNDCANFKENTELFNTDKATGKDVSDELHCGTSNAKNFLLRVHGLKLRDKLLETKRNTDLSNSSAQLSSDLRSCTTSTGEACGEMTACLSMKSVLNDVTDVNSESSVLTFEKTSSVFPESFNDPNPNFNTVTECNDVSVSDNPSAVDVENNNQSPGQSVTDDTDNNNTIEHMSDVVPKADIKKVVSNNFAPASNTESETIETTNVPPASSVSAPKPPSEFSDLTLVDGFRVRVISKSEATDNSYDGSLGSHTESSGKKKHPESSTSLPAPSAVTSSFGQPPVFKINLHHDRTLDDMEIMNSSSTDPLAAPPLTPLTSEKTRKKDYAKLRRQNKALLDVVHILRKELATAKDGKEKAERICKYYEGVIHDITSTYRSGDEETPISIPDDDCKYIL